MGIQKTSILLSAAMSAFAMTNVKADECLPSEMTDVTPSLFNLEYTPTSEFGNTLYYFEYTNQGPNVTTRRIDSYLYELDDNLERGDLILSRWSNNPVSVGLWFGSGGYSNAIVQGKAYEVEVVYPCDTNLENNSIYQIAHNINPPEVIFRDGMEGPSSLPPVKKAPALKP